MSRAERGLTLLEVALSSVLLGLLLALFILVLAPLGRAAATGAERVELRQMAVACVEKLGADLDRTSPPGLTLREAPTMAAIQPLAALTTSGHQTWENNLILYVHENERVTRRAWSALASLTSPPTPPDLAHLAGQNNATILAGWVRDLRIERTGLVLRLRLDVKRGPETYTVRFSQVLRTP